MFYSHSQVRANSVYPDRTVEYHIVCKYSKRQTQANTVDPDQTPQKAASDVDLNCLHEVQIFYFKYLDSQARTKSIDPDQMQQNATS